MWSEENLRRAAKATSVPALVVNVVVLSGLWGAAGHFGFLGESFASAAPVGAAVAVIGWAGGRLMLWGERGSRVPQDRHNR